MKKLIVFFLLFATSVTFAKESKKEEETKRNPASPGLVNAYLEVAEQLATERVNGRVCETNAYPGEIMNMVQSAAFLEDFSANLVKKNTLSELGKVIAFKELTGQFDSLNETVENYTKALVNSNFYAPAAGVMGSSSTIEFLAGGKAKVSVAVWENDEIKHKVYEANWQVFAPTKKTNGLFRIGMSYQTGKTLHKEVFRLDAKYEDGHKMWFLHSSRGHKGSGVAPQKIKYYNEIIDECSA